MRSDRVNAQCERLNVTNYEVVVICADLQLLSWMKGSLNSQGVFSWFDCKGDHLLVSSYNVLNFKFIGSRDQRVERVDWC